jgi:hypothetical protein
VVTSGTSGSAGGSITDFVGISSADYGYLTGSGTIENNYMDPVNGTFMLPGTTNGGNVTFANNTNMVTGHTFSDSP